MKKFAFVPLFAIALVVGCDAAKEAPVTPEAPAVTEISGASFSSSAGEASISLEGQSTVCIAYQQSRDEAAAANDAQMVADLEQVIATNCK